MMFRNMTFYRFPPAACAAALADLESAAEAHPFREAGAMELASTGFVSPLTYDTTAAFALRNGGVSVIAVANETKIIPPSAIAAAVKKRTVEIIASEQRRIGARERKRIRENALAELLPRALSRRAVILGIVDATQGWVAVGTSSRRAAEDFISLIRKAIAIGRFPVTPITPNESPRMLLTDWVMRGRPPAPWATGDECVLRDPSDSGSRWSGRRIEIDSDEVKEHLRNGMQVFSLGAELEDRCSFVIDESLCIRKFALTDTLLDAFSEQHESFESAQEERIARLTLESMEILRLLGHIETTFGTPVPDARA